jgi:CheY-like chemotaxis protein
MEILRRDDCRPRFLIADEDAIFAESLRMYLEQTYPVVGVVSDGRALIDAACRLKPEAIVADVAMPILNGLDATCRIGQSLFSTTRTARSGCFGTMATEVFSCALAANAMAMFFPVERHLRRQSVFASRTKNLLQLRCIKAPVAWRRAPR